MVQYQGGKGGGGGGGGSDKPHAHVQVIAFHVACKQEYGVMRLKYGVR